MRRRQIAVRPRCTGPTYVISRVVRVSRATCLRARIRKRVKDVWVSPLRVCPDGAVKARRLALLILVLSGDARGAPGVFKSVLVLVGSSRAVYTGWRAADGIAGSAKGAQLLPSVARWALYLVRVSCGDTSSHPVAESSCYRGAQGTHGRTRVGLKLPAWASRASGCARAALECAGRARRAGGCAHPCLERASCARGAHGPPSAALEKAS